MPAIYNAPLKDIRFLIHGLLEGGGLSSLAKYHEITPDLMGAVLDEGARLCEQEFLAVNASGDEQGCNYDVDTQSVTTPAGFKQAYQAFVECGWLGISMDETWGGQAMPHLLGFAMEEMSCAANLSLSMYPGLTVGAMNLIATHANEQLQQAYLPNMVSGQWSGTMCLTEPQCGTDLGMIRTKAEPQDDGSYAISGNKIWITSGEHDLAENIIHLVLARLPDAPEGVKGISLFLVPKVLEDSRRNALGCTGLEHKMGIRGSATCFMNFDNAVGWLVGEPHKGLSCMFTMMNAARLMVGLQGLGTAESAYQTALSFARERLQSRSISGPVAPDQPADPILVHPDVRRMLLRQKVINEGNRALAYWTAMHIDISLHHDDEAVRQQADDIVQLMTPVVKAHLTDEGFDCCNLALQTLGGSGFTKDWGIEQLVRDVRITRIYEGTNGIQALDLVGRKLPMQGGRLIRSFLQLLDTELKAYSHHRHYPAVKAARDDMQAATFWLAQEGVKDPEEVAQGATPYLRLLALTAIGWLWLKMSLKAEQMLADGDPDVGFYQGKIKSADFYMAKVLAETTILLKDIQSGKQVLMAFGDEEF
ncbi:acyl-CoA dehydrogenase C-terminal domain-containing protein [Kistimonas scapharcae]|uniref:Acyl-CoA dehydrogenase C-terminal domain-containing protein n=1 Tax=Kistimonas scapharcae TaxID=1036133 RepID=A0ABP8V922_9GAMM